ncbi:glycolate oxidase [Nannochloropsis gaditana]|uniref:Glycolate oxidase n=1 Tax=Nannochloropsis gaditana TaxID=72520 RepID=W7TK72_9STRA|nr:glycolate oxidase [Nannochloropsis gaditana]
MGDVKRQQAAAVEASIHQPLERLLSLDDVQAEARKRLPKALYEYVASGSDDEQTLWENRQGFKRHLLCPRVGVDVSKVDMSLTLFEDTDHAQHASLPIMISPAGVHCLMHPDGEIATVRAAQREQVIMGVSQHATTCMEDVARAAVTLPTPSPASSPPPSAPPSTPLWYQLYILRDRSLTLSLVRRAESSGYQALILTVDSPVFGFREADWRNGFAGLPEGMILANYPTKHAYDDRMKGGWDQNSEALLDRSSSFERDLPWLCSVTSLPVVVKGIVAPEDAVAAAEAGCHGIIVSNHGGRQLDSCISSIEALPGIAEALRQKGFLLDADRRAQRPRARPAGSQRGERGRRGIAASHCRTSTGGIESFGARAEWGDGVDGFLTEWLWTSMRWIPLRLGGIGILTERGRGKARSMACLLE